MKVKKEKPYIVIKYPDSHDTYITRCATLKEALKVYKEALELSSSPILTEVFDVTYTASKVAVNTPQTPSEEG